MFTCAGLGGLFEQPEVGGGAGAGDPRVAGSGDGLQRGGGAHEALSAGLALCGGRGGDGCPALGEAGLRHLGDGFQIVTERQLLRRFTPRQRR